MINIKGILDTSNKGLMIGNSSLGAIIFGADFLSISLDKVDLWDERKPKEFNSPLFTYGNLVNLLKNDYEKAYDIFDTCYLYPYPTKINAGIIKTNIKVDASDEGIIDTDKAEITYKAKNNQLRAYVDANKDVIVINSDKPFDYEVEMPKYFYKSVKDNGLNYSNKICTSEDRYKIVVQPMYGKKSFMVVSYSKDNFIFITITKDKNVQKSKDLLINYAQNQQFYYKKHLLKVKKFNNASYIKTPDKKINDLYNLGKYYFYSNSSKKYPVTLQGVWTQYNDKLPPWKSDLHNDLNVQLSYEPFFKTGNYKESKVLLDYLVKKKKQFKDNAKKFLQTEGIYIPGVMTQKGEPLGGWPQYSLNLTCQIWVLNAFDNYYQYCGDNEYLKGVIFPFFKDIESSVSSLLEIDDEGKLVFGFHSSPEYNENNVSSLFEYQSNFEINCLKYLYSKLAEYCVVLGLDSSYYDSQLNKIRPFYTDTNGELLVSKNVKFDISHRHFSHILGYKNLPVYDPYQYQDNINKDLRNLINQGTDNWVGFSYTEYADFLTLVNDGEDAYQALKIFTSNFVHDNGFHMNNDFKENKYSKMDCYVFTLEGNFSFVNALDDMMLKNYKNKVTLFPSLPSLFINKGVSFKNLRLHRGHKVSAKRKKNSLSFIVKMNCEDTLLIENNFKKNPSLIIDGKTIVFTSNVGEFLQIKANKDIIFKDII